MTTTHTVDTASPPAHEQRRISWAEIAVSFSRELASADFPRLKSRPAKEELATCPRYVHARSLTMTRRLIITIVFSLFTAACVPITPESAGLGTVVVRPGDSIHIRALVPLTFVGELGVPSYRGAALAVHDYGPIHGHDIELVGYDTSCSDSAAVKAANAVVGDPRIIGVIGPSCSFAAATAAPILSQAGLVLISPSNTAPSLTSNLHGRPGEHYHLGYFRVSNNDLYQAQAVAEFAYHNLGLRNIAAIHDGDPYTSGLVSAYTAVFEELGGSTTTFKVSKGEVNMVPLLTEIVAVSPDAIYMPLFPAEGVNIVRQIQQFPYLSEAARIGGAGLLAPEFLAIPESEGIYLPGPELDFVSNVNQATGRSGEELMTTYREVYKEEPTTPFMLHAYDAATLLLQAIEKVAVADGNALYIDRAALREALSDIDGFNGITGALSCDEFGDCGTGKVRISHHIDSNVTDVDAIPVVYRYSP